MSSDYLFEKLTIPVTKNPTALQERFFKPTTGIVTGGLVGAWGSALIVAGEPYLPVFVIATIILYVTMGALVGYNINKHVFYRQVQRKTVALNNMTMALTRNVPQGWEMQEDEAEAFLGKEQAWVFDPAGLRWEIVDSFQDTKEIHLTLRRNNY